MPQQQPHRHPKRADHVLLAHDRPAHHHHDAHRLVHELLEDILRYPARIRAGTNNPQQLGALSLQR
jgi:hypothetical protein